MSLLITRKVTCTQSRHGVSHVRLKARLRTVKTDTAVPTAS